MIDGEVVERIEGTLADGRTAGWLKLANTNNITRACVTNISCTASSTACAW